MIKVFKAKCIKELSYEKTEFVMGELYYAYAIGSSVTVINGNVRKGFCDTEKCMFRHGHPYGFQIFFETLETFHVENKKQLKSLINSLKD